MAMAMAIAITTVTVTVMATASSQTSWFDRLILLHAAQFARASSAIFAHKHTNINPLQMATCYGKSQHELNMSATISTPLEQQQQQQQLPSPAKLKINGSGANNNNNIDDELKFANWPWEAPTIVTIITIIIVLWRQNRIQK